MDMASRRRRIRQKNPTVEIELHPRHGAVDAVVERVVVAAAPDPREVRPVDVRGEVGQAVRQHARRVVGVEGQEEGGDEVAGRGGEERYGDAFVGDDAVVLPRAAEVALVEGVPAAGGEAGSVHAFAESGFLL